MSSHSLCALHCDRHVAVHQRRMSGVPRCWTDLAEIAFETTYRELEATMSKKMGFYEATIKVLGDTERKDETETVKAVKREAMELDTGIETLKFRARKIADMFDRCAKALEGGQVVHINDPSGHCDTDKFPVLVQLHEQRFVAFRTLVRTALGTETLEKILNVVVYE